MGHSTVMLSAAKHLSAQRDRPFASLRVTVRTLPVRSSSTCSARQTLRCAQGDSGGADFIIRLIF